MERIKEEYNLAEDMCSLPLFKKETVDFISSGCTNLNLELSGKGRDGGWARGRIVNIVGDGSTGKTLLALEAAAWFYHNIKKVVSKIYSKVKKVTIVYNNVEFVMDFPVAFMYGKKFYEAVEWVQIPYIEDTSRDFLRRVQNLKTNESLLYIIDSWDALDSKGEGEAFNDAIKEDKELDGSFDLGKQKFASKRLFKKICETMVNKDVTLMIVSQTRTKISTTKIFGKAKYRAGGDALNFYTHQVVWLYERGRIEKQALNKKKMIGIRVKAKVERNKVAPPWGEADMTILFNYGVDDVRSMVDWYFGPSKKVLKWNDEEYKREDLIKVIERDESIADFLREEIENKWYKIIELTQLKDGRKYD